MPYILHYFTAHTPGVALTNLLAITGHVPLRYSKLPVRPTIQIFSSET